ncbi:hypothetical protein SAMN02799630_02400 [Paenibacillus sp. UNCCL117]|uniref:hypothetical protein n=1 Tax=unclassified Paenibacillus TaxID=185978 RepID=UPI00088EB49C|nr:MULTISPECIES: hypothetical protein [unclassified Paenibacillus]SDC00435.1 hypothetical protein SAMN04488602_10168 [Paenibacillus sp. cl123]SFW36361.1 hypothetical protein SAMN02799630_02400 [Paenibacillus sp. UNCCL117]
MKIALHNELPCEAQVRELIDAMTGQASSLEAFEYETLRSGGKRLIAAYDQDRLVGLGKLAEEGISSGSAIEFAILPAYRGRQIETYMSKLLLAALPKTAVPAC